MSTFSKFHPLLQSQIVQTLGWTSLRPVQEEAGSAVLEGKNCIVLAPTAGGKTEASFFPVISQVLYDNSEGLKAIYISPIKALINNIESRIETYSSMVNLSVFKWHGDTTPNKRKKFIEEPADILLTTPESIEVMLISSKVNKKIFKPLRYIIIDEIHAFAAVDRGIHFLAVLERLKYLIRTDFQRIGLSATVGNPKELLDWMQGSSLNDKVVIDPPSSPSTSLRTGPSQKLIEISYEEDNSVLVKSISQKVKESKSLIFCESRKLAEEIGKYFQRMEIDAFVHHSSLSLTTRAIAEKEFSESRFATIISTSTMELGIDVGDLDKVIQVEAPSTVASFLQRLGRTGRREGTIANTSFFISNGVNLLLAIALVELAKKKQIECVRFKKNSWHILVHQIMAMCLQWGGVNRTTIWENLHSVYSFSTISKDKLNKFIEDLIRNEFLFEDNGYLSMGEKAESLFGRKNFMEIYSVISSVQEFSVVKMNGSEIGKIQQDFAESLFPGISTFLLAGKAWMVERIDWNKSLIIVSSSPSGKTPQWSSIQPRFLNYEICREMRNILISTEEYNYLKENAKEKLALMRKETGEFLRSSFAPMEIGEDGLTWWTYAGGKINNTLKFALRIETNYDVVSSNEYIRIEKKGFLLEEFSSILEKIQSPDYFRNRTVLSKITKIIPGYRLSKFQPCLSDEYQKAVISQEIMDVDGTKMFFGKFKESNIRS